MESRDKTSERLNISPEQAQKLTKVTFSPEQWGRFFGASRPYDQNKIFFGVPSEEETAEGTIFDKVYDETGKFCGGIISAKIVESK